MTIHCKRIQCCSAQKCDLGDWTQRGNNGDNDGNGRLWHTQKCHSTTSKHRQPHRSTEVANITVQRHSHSHGVPAQYESHNHSQRSQVIQCACLQRCTRTSNSKGTHSNRTQTDHAQISDFGLSFIGKTVKGGADITHYKFTRPPEMIKPDFVYNPTCDVYR